MKKQILFSLALAIMLFIASCGIGVRMKSMAGFKLNVEVDISDKANLNSPLAVDLLLVYDEKLLETLLKTDSRDWFKKKKQIKKDHLKGEGLDCWEWEWIPGQTIPLQKLALKPKAKGGLIFANYLPPGVHRSRFDPFTDFSLHLLEKDFYIEIED